jgi:hypothetical protein
MSILLLETQGTEKLKPAFEISFISWNTPQSRGHKRAEEKVTNNNIGMAMANHRRIYCKEFFLIDQRLQQKI